MDWILDFYNIRVVAQYLPEFGRGVLSTMGISLVALVLSLVLGIITALMSLSGRKVDVPLLHRIVGAVLRYISAGYVAAIRSTPLLVQIYLIYYALPALPLLGRRLTDLEGGILALGLNAGAFMSEIIRAGIESIERGQVEGAMSVGMTYVQRMRYIVLPQAFARVVPPLLGQTAVLIKDSSLVSFIAVFELFSAGVTLYSERLMPNEAYVTVAACYLVIYYFMFFFSNYAQRKLGGAYA
jgi:polar amino acid transport system permease protein